MAQAQKELGPEALLLNTRKLAGSPGGYEVVLGVNDSAPEPKPTLSANATLLLPTPQPSVSPASSPAVPANSSTELLASELEKLRAQMDEIQELLARSTQSRVWEGHSAPEIAEVYANLLAAQVVPWLAKDIVDRFEAARASREFATNAESGEFERSQTTAEDREKFLRLAFERSIRFSATLGLISPGTLKPATILVGPTGGGKTTTAAKLAVVASQQMRVSLLSLNHSRSSPASQLQSLTSSPGIIFKALRTLDRLSEVIDEARRDRCVVVDTAGHAEKDWPAAEKLASALAKCREVDVQLVVPAYINAVDFRRVIDRYAIFHPSKLLVTKTDEAATLGTAVSEAARADLALSFATNGPSVPQDIRAISASDLAALGLRQPGSKGRRAA